MNEGSNILGTPGFNVPPVPGLESLDEAEIERLYGRWKPMQPEHVSALFNGAPFRWWIAGGLAIEAAAGRTRAHLDTDVVILLRDLGAVREWLSAFHLWEVQDGTLRPLLPGDRLTQDREQLWVRRDAASPWELDLLLTPAEGDQWLFKRDHNVRKPLDEIGHYVGGVAYLQPVIVLLFKAKHHRPKDDSDFDRMLPHLPGDQRIWLASALRTAEPDHPWLAKLE
jgi:hypothetical protein